MAKRATKARVAVSWLEGLDAEAVEAVEAAHEAAYNEDEQHTGFLTALEEQLVFPFTASVMGETRQVVAMEWPERDEFGLDLLVERNGELYRVDAKSVELVRPFPDGHLTLAAYLKWRQFV